MAHVLIPLADGCEELEAVTIIDLLRRAEIGVVTAGLEEGPVKASRGVVLLPDTTLQEALDRNYDMVVLPGGLPGSDYLDQDPRIAELLKSMVANGKPVAAICAAPKVLANAGLLKGKSATSYPGVLDEMNVEGMSYTGDAVTKDGNIITSRGPGTAMDFALTLIEELEGREKRLSVESALVR
jgi:4-methyl-5(b-hydroxyethyl)-thiazole monophosphate biosynthesis